MKINLPPSLVAQVVAGFRPLKLNKSKMPLLQCLRLSITPGKITVTGSNLDEGLIYANELATDQTADLLIPIGLLIEAAKQGDGDVVLILANDKWSLTYLTAGVKVTLVVNAPDVAEFPPVPEFPAEGQPTPA